MQKLHGHAPRQKLIAGLGLQSLEPTAKPLQVKVRVVVPPLRPSKENPLWHVVATEAKSVPESAVTWLLEIATVLQGTATNNMLKTIPQEKRE
jgi:hypothetical protein